MENFFYNDDFCRNYNDLMELLGIDENDLIDTKVNWQVQVELADHETIFDVTPEYLCELLANANEDRLTENFKEEEDVINALKQSIDFEKLMKLLPKNYYPSGKYVEVTKNDLL